MKVRGVDPRVVTWEGDEPAFYLVNWYALASDSSSPKLESPILITGADVVEVVEWMRRVPAPQEPGWRIARRELFAISRRPDVVKYEEQSDFEVECMAIPLWTQNFE